MAGYAVPFPGDQYGAHSPQPVYAQAQPVGYAPSTSPYPQQIQIQQQPSVQYVQQQQPGVQYVPVQQPGAVQYVPSPPQSVQYAQQPMQMQAPLSPTPPGGQAGAQQIQPGTITYTTSTGPDGRTVYNQFKAVAAAYQTPQGVVTGIQWIPAEATSVLPQNAQPANAVQDFAASWNRGYLSRDEERSLKDWQRDEEKRRRKEEKAAAKRMDKWERERLERELAEDREDRELRKARERDTMIAGSMSGSTLTNGSSAASRMRRKSFSANAAPSAGLVGGFGQVPAGVGVGGYGTAAPFPSSGFDREYAPAPGSDLERRFENLGLGPDREPYEQHEPVRAKRERRMSTGFALPRSRKTSVVGFADAPPRRPIDGDESPTDMYPPGGGFGAGYAASGGSGYAPGAAGYTGSRAQPSPYHGGGGLPGGYPVSYSGSDGSAGRGESGYGRDGYGRGEGEAGYGRREGAGYVGRANSMYGGEERVYPRGHILEGQPMPAGGQIPGMPSSTSGAPYAYPTSRPPSRGSAYPPRPASRNAGYAAAPGGGAYPAPYPTSRPPSRMAGSNMPSATGYNTAGADASVLDTPEGFRRPPNLAQPYTTFDTIKIQEMDDFAEHIPRMPAVLMPHDVYHEDWIRFMQDVSLAWEGKLPMPDQRPRRRSSILIDLIELWNTSFFLGRGVEVVLYKGRERRTGAGAGTYDPNLPMLDEAELMSSSESDSEDDSEEQDERQRAQTTRFGYGGGGSYSRQFEAQMTEAREARRRRRERKLEKKRRNKEKKLRRKVRERERKYVLYLTYVPLREGMPGGSMY